MGNSLAGQSPAPSQPAKSAKPAKQVYDELTFNNTPNQLTLLRIGFVPVVVALLYIKDPTWDLVAAAVFGIASLTDWFDGYIARRNQQITVYGKLLDPLADKFLVVCSLIMLQELGRIPAYVVMLLICREIAITGLRALASAEGLIISSSDSAKWKTATQMIAIPLLIIGKDYFGLPFVLTGLACLGISLLISLWSAGSYVAGFFRSIAEKRRSRSVERKRERELRAAARAERKAKKAFRKIPKARL
jgi:CDP-diacylglycerol--glycerol-3-phosphate 3-phosphatidyltransferase